MSETRFINGDGGVESLKVDSQAKPVKSYSPLFLRGILVDKVSSDEIWKRSSWRKTTKVKFMLTLEQEERSTRPYREGRKQFKEKARALRALNRQIEAFSKKMKKEEKKNLDDEEEGKKELNNEEEMETEGKKELNNEEEMETEGKKGLDKEEEMETEGKKGLNSKEEKERKKGLDIKKEKKETGMNEEKNGKQELEQKIKVKASMEQQSKEENDFFEKRTAQPSLASRIKAFQPKVDCKVTIPIPPMMERKFLMENPLDDTGIIVTEYRDKYSMDEEEAALVDDVIIELGATIQDERAFRYVYWRKILKTPMIKCTC